MWTFSWLAEIWTLLSSLLLVYGKFNPAAPFSTSGLCWPLPFPFQMLWTRETVRWSAPPWKSCRIWWCLRIWWERLWCLTTGRSSPSSTSSRTWTVSSSHACGQMVRQRDVSAHDCEAVIVLLVPLCSNSFFFYSRYCYASESKNVSEWHLMYLWAVCLLWWDVSTELQESGECCTDVKCLFLFDFESCFILFSM